MTRIHLNGDTCRVDGVLVSVSELGEIASKILVFGIFEAMEPKQDWKGPYSPLIVASAQAAGDHKMDWERGIRHFETSSRSKVCSL